MEPNNGSLEDDFPFQLADFLGSMLIFRGVSRFVEISILVSSLAALVVF